MATKKSGKKAIDEIFKAKQAAVEAAENAEAAEAPARTEPAPPELIQVGPHEAKLLKLEPVAGDLDELWDTYSAKDGELRYRRSRESGKIVRIA